MKLVHLLDIANQGYPDHGLSMAYNPEDGAEPEGADDEVGDTLALFIVRELRDTFEPTNASDVQLAAAVVAMEGATLALAGVFGVLKKALDKT